MKYLCIYVNSKIGEDQSAEDAEDGPPELLVSTLVITMEWLSFLTL